MFIRIQYRIVDFSGPRTGFTSHYKGCGLYSIVIISPKKGSCRAGPQSFPIRIISQME